MHFIYFCLLWNAGFYSIAVLTFFPNPSFFSHVSSISIRSNRERTHRNSISPTQPFVWRFYTFSASSRALSSSTDSQIPFNQRGHQTRQPTQEPPLLLLLSGYNAESNARGNHNRLQCTPPKCRFFDSFQSRTTFKCH
jgi:hypothetical protein